MCCALQAYQQPGSASYAAGGAGGYGYGRGAYDAYPVSYSGRSTQSASVYIKNLPPNVRLQHKRSTCVTLSQMVARVADLALGTSVYPVGIENPAKSAAGGQAVPIREVCAAGRCPVRARADGRDWQLPRRWLCQLCRPAGRQPGKSEDSKPCRHMVSLRCHPLLTCAVCPRCGGRL